MENALLSVVLITRKNTSLSILNTLNSILNQIYSPIRVLVIDANEPNSLYSLGLQEDLAEYPNVDYLQLEPLLTITEIRNYALNSVEGEYIAFLSSNDTWDSTKALLQIEQLKNEPKSAASCSNGVLIDKRKTHITVEPLIEHLIYDTTKWILDSPAKMSAQVIYRINKVKEAGGFDVRFFNFGDGDMLLRLVKKNKVSILPLSLCECNIISDNKEYDRNNFRDGQNILHKYMELFLANKQMTLMFYIRMMHLAKQNYLWLNYFGYISLYFTKAPIRSFLMLMQILEKTVEYMLKWLRRTFSLFKEEIRIRKDVRLFRRGKFKKVKTLNPAKVPVVKEDKTFSYSSSNKYYEQNTLTYVFDHKLTKIIIPEYVSVIKKSMFYGCDQLITVEIPNTVLEIQAHAFQNCKNLRHVVFHEGSRLSKIGAYAFAGCSTLEMMILPSGIVEIGRGAFFECCSLRELLFVYMQRGQLKTSGNFPTAIEKIPRLAFAGCTSLLAVEFGSGSMLEKVENDAFIGCLKMQKILLAGKIKTLGSYAFAYCKKLETVALPQIDKLMSIGKCTFMYCEALTYFQLSNHMEHIYMRTFYGCNGLKQIKIPKKVISINHQAFAKCTALEKVIILTGDIAISSTAFEKNTSVQLLENTDTVTSSEE